MSEEYFLNNVLSALHNKTAQDIREYLMTELRFYAYVEKYKDYRGPDLSDLD